MHIITHILTDSKDFIFLGEVISLRLSTVAVSYQVRYVTVLGEFIREFGKMVDGIIRLSVIVNLKLEKKVLSLK